MYAKGTQWSKVSKIYLVVKGNKKVLIKTMYPKGTWRSNLSNVYLVVQAYFFMGGTQTQTHADTQIHQYKEFL